MIVMMCINSAWSP